MVKVSTWILAALMLVMEACCWKEPCPGPPLSLPSASEVDHVDLIRWRPNGDFDAYFQVSDRRWIAEMLDQIVASTPDLYLRMELRPFQEYSIAFYDRDKMKALVWIAPGWIGGVDDRHAVHADRWHDGDLIARYRFLQPADHAKLTALLARASGAG